MLLLTSAVRPMKASANCAACKQLSCCAAPLCVVLARQDKPDTCVHVAWHAGHAGDNGAPLSATLSSPRGLVVNAAGELFIAVTGSHCVRRVNAAGTNITTVAGVCGTSGSGPVGAATSAQLASPNGVALSSDGSTLFIADTGNNKVGAPLPVRAVTACITTQLATYLRAAC